MISFFDLFLILFIGLAATFDIKERRIPNWLILLALVAGFLLNAWHGAPQFQSSVSGLFLGIAFFFIPFALGMLGAGDVKLMGAVGAVLGAGWVPRVVFYSVLSGAVLACVVMMVKGLNVQTITSIWREIKLFVISRGAVQPVPVREKSQRRVGTIPYGVAIAVGTLVAFYWDPKREWAGF